MWFCGVLVGVFMEIGGWFSIRFGNLVSMCVEVGKYLEFLFILLIGKVIYNEFWFLVKLDNLMVFIFILLFFLFVFINCFLYVFLLKFCFFGLFWVLYFFF